MFIWGMITGIAIYTAVLFTIGLCISAKYRDELGEDEE
jgi:hypothetical protein